MDGRGPAVHRRIGRQECARRNAAAGGLASCRPARSAGIVHLTPLTPCTDPSWLGAAFCHRQKSKDRARLERGSNVMAATITADAHANPAKKPWYKILYVQ